MNNIETNRFDDFFTDQQYLRLKNYLYNYRLRKRAIRKCLNPNRLEFILEIGSGISPLVINRPNVVYSDISFDAVKSLKKIQKSGYYVVANGTHLPFKSHKYAHAICSEVLEHLPDDRPALAEICRILKKPSGEVIITLPHRNCYFGYDDRYVKHFRRYEIPEIKAKLKSAGLEPVLVRKVLGPLEKFTMIPVVYLFAIVKKLRSDDHFAERTRNKGLIRWLVPIFKWANFIYAGFVWLDARMMPQSLATVILIKSAVSGGGTQDN